MKFQKSTKLLYLCHLFKFLVARRQSRTVLSCVRKLEATLTNMFTHKRFEQKSELKN